MKKIFAFCCAMVLLNCSVGSIPTFAENTFVYQETVEEKPIITATGLITDYELSIWKSGSTLYLNACTIAVDTMKKVGFKDIVVEYSANNSDWDTYTNIGDVLNSSTNSCYMTNYSVPITNGYYYRVTLTHYAKETGWFGSSQSVPNTSNVVS